MRILVVDDNHDSADSMAFLLRLFGHDVKAAYDASALETAKSLQPDVCLLDLAMPQMNGLTMAKKLRQQHQNAQIIALTGHPNRFPSESAADAGFDHYLRKPVDRFALQRILEEKAD